MSGEGEADDELWSVDIEDLESASSDSFLRAVAAASLRSAQVEQLGRTGGTLGGYRIGPRLGAGGMGIVYRAEDREGRPAALKVLRRRSSDDGGEATRRFLREGRSALAVVHPNVARVFEIGEDDGEFFLAMELLSGETLRAKLARGPLTIAQAVRLAIDVASGVSAAHAAGVVHRDLKPDNVMITADGTAKVLDFGLARWITPEGALDARSLLTKDGAILGTCGYMSPEQATGRAVDARTDIFSLGVVSFEMLAGRRPFLGQTNVDVFIATSREPAPDLRALRSDVPPDVAEIVAAMLEKAPDRRPALAAVLDGLRPHG